MIGGDRSSLRSRLVHKQTDAFVKAFVMPCHLISHYCIFIHACCNINKSSLPFFIVS